MKSSNLKRNITAIICVLVLVVLDQFTKYISVAKLMNQKDFILIPNVLQLHYLENTGAAFSIMEGKQIFFRIITPIALIIMAFLFVLLVKAL